MLTDKSVKSVGPKEKLYRISDKSRNGLCLEVTPEGKKRWRFRYRFDGAAKMISLGVLPSCVVKRGSGQSQGSKKKFLEMAKTPRRQRR